MMFDGEGLGVDGLPSIDGLSEVSEVLKVWWYF